MTRSIFGRLRLVEFWLSDEDLLSEVKRLVIQQLLVDLEAPLYWSDN